MGIVTLERINKINFILCRKRYYYMGNGRKRGIVNSGYGFQECEIVHSLSGAHPPPYNFGSKDRD